MHTTISLRSQNLRTQFGICKKLYTLFFGLGCSAQLFQATATVAISWWASSFLREDTEDKSSKMEQEVSPHDSFSNFNTKGMFLTCNIGLQDYQK